MITENTTGTHDGRHGLEHPGFEPGERLDVADLTEDPRLDSEALCLCGLLWSTPTAARRVVDLLVAGDFTCPTHAELFTMIAAQLAQGRPHDPASIARSSPTGAPGGIGVG